MKSLFIDFSKGFIFSSRRKKNILSLFVQLKIRNYKRNFSGYFSFKISYLLVIIDFLLSYIHIEKIVKIDNLVSQKRNDWGKKNPKFHFRWNYEK